eukprot:TRINITY_DN6727_c0_g2_i1.p2 TRINITY_DN6727_c0_g2~~TRINITY_DN6727_c0_g2_i1.p2  ORF type:complete len:183 (+),score=38.04 TRINITY_DN6727_c0_g2_i1:12-560(+)
MIRRPPRSTQSRSSAASDVYKRQLQDNQGDKDTFFTEFNQNADQISGRIDPFYWLGSILVRNRGSSLIDGLFSPVSSSKLKQSVSSIITYEASIRFLFMNHVLQIINPPPIIVKQDGKVQILNKNTIKNVRSGSINTLFKITEGSKLFDEMTQQTQQSNADTIPNKSIGKNHSDVKNPKIPC